MTAVTIDHGDFDPGGETTYLIKKPSPKKTSAAATTSIFKGLYLKQAAPIFFAVVLSFLAGRNSYPATSKNTLVEIVKTDSLQSSHKIPECNCTTKGGDDEETEEEEEEDISWQLNRPRFGPELAFNISEKILEVINETGSLDMEMILNEVNKTYFDLGVEAKEDFYELIDAAFLHAPDLMEDLSELIEDESHTNLFIQTENPTILSKVKNFTVTREEMLNHTRDLVDEAIFIGRGEQDLSESASVQDSRSLDIENGFPSISFLAKKFLDLPVTESSDNIIGGASVAEENQEHDISWEDKFKELPESVSVLQESYKSLAEARLEQIMKFDKERTEKINDEDPPSSAPSSAPSSESQTRLRYLTKSSTDEKDRLMITSSELEKMNPRRPKNQFTLEPISNTRKLLNLANEHVSSGFSQQLRGIAENDNRKLGGELCDDDDDTNLRCQGAKLLASARSLDEMFCDLSTLLVPMDKRMNELNNTRTTIDNSASLSKVVLTALKIGTGLPYGIGTFLNAVYNGLVPIDAKLIKQLNTAAERAQKKVIKPWEATIGKALDTIDDLTLNFMTYSSLFVTIGGVLEDETSCLADILLSVLKKATEDVSDAVSEALKKLIVILNDLTSALTEALKKVLDTLKNELWKKTMVIFDGIVKAGKVLWGLFDPFRKLIEIIQTEIEIPWFHLPYAKKVLGEAQCPAENWDRDVFKKNCYEKCESGFEDVPHLTAWRCRPTCSSMNSYAGVGGCWNKNYERKTKRRNLWRGCGNGWDWVMFGCRKDCRAGFTAPWMARYCYQTSCPANFSPRLGNRFCARNSKNKRWLPTTCDQYSDAVPANRGSYIDTFGKCRTKCEWGHVDMGLACFQPATLSISIQDIADALKEIMNAIMGLPIVSTIKNALEELIGRLLKPIQDTVATLIDGILGFNLDFLGDILKWLENPLDGILDWLPGIPSPLPDVSKIIQQFYDLVLKGIIEKVSPLPPVLLELIKCIKQGQGQACFIGMLPLPENIANIIEQAEELEKSFIGMLEILQECSAVGDFDDANAKSITAAISDMFEAPRYVDTCTLKLPLPACNNQSIASLQMYAKSISDSLKTLSNSNSNSRRAVEATNVLGSFDGMIKILSVDILRPKDQAFIKSGVHRLHALPKTNRQKKEVYDIFRYEKIPSTKLNVYMKQDFSVPVVEYESSIEWNIFTKKDSNTRSLLSTVVASLNVFLWEEMYWDLEGWCYQWSSTNLKYEPLPVGDKNLKKQCKTIYTIEKKFLGDGGCRAETCNVPLMEELLVEHGELSKYWKDESNVDSTARCALSLSILYNDAVDAKGTFISNTRLADGYFLKGLKKDIFKTISVPLSVTSKDSNDVSFNGNDYYHLGFGNKTATEMSDTSDGSISRFKMGDFQISMVEDASEWYSISVGQLVKSFQRRKLPIFKDKNMKIGLSGQTVTISATKAVLNIDTMKFDPTPSPTSDPTRSPTSDPTQSPTSDPTPIPIQTYEFPPDETEEFVHGLCAMGASEFSATSDDPSLKYVKGSDNFEDGIMLWADRKVGSGEYTVSNVEGAEVCESGIYLEPSRVKEIKQGTVISVNFKSENYDSDVTICAFITDSPGDGRNGRWNVSLPLRGFEKSSKTLKWTGNNGHWGILSIYCKKIIPPPTPAQAAAAQAAAASAQAAAASAQAAAASAQAAAASAVVGH